MKETLHDYWSSVRSLATEKLNLDPQKHLCTFRFKVILTTLTVCCILFSAAGMAAFMRMPAGDGDADGTIMNAELKEQLKKSDAFSTIDSISTDPDEDTDEPDEITTPLPTQPNPDIISYTTSTVRPNGLLDRLRKRITPCPPGQKLLPYEDLTMVKFGPGFPRSVTMICKFPPRSSTSKPNFHEKMIDPKRKRDKPGVNILKVITPRHDPRRLPTTTRRPLLKNRHTPRRLLKGRTTTRRPSHHNRPRYTHRPHHRSHSTHRPFIFPFSTPRPGRGSKIWIRIKIYCQHVCKKDPSAGGHFCFCDDPPMEVESKNHIFPPRRQSYEELEKVGFEEFNRQI